MATPAQIEANRQNAQKSTGPKTPEGKAIASQNSITHGLTGSQVVISGEDPDAFAQFRTQLLDELLPKGPMETMLADRIIELSWRLKRAGRIQSGTYNAFTTEQNDAEDNTLGQIAIRDFSNSKVLDRLLMHERRIEHSLYKTMLELQRLQFIRTKYQSLLHDSTDYDDSDLQEMNEIYD